MEEHRLRVFENRVLRRIFGRKRDEVTGDWRKLHNEELHNLYSSPNIIRMIKSRRKSCEICGGQSGAGAGFFRVLRLPLPIFILPISSESPSPIIRGSYNRPVVAAVPKVPPPEFKKSQGE
jgi:hypothetical protein